MIPKKKDEQVKNLEWTKLKGLLGEKALDRQSKEKQHSEELGFKSDQLQAQKQQNSFDNKLKLAELIGKKPSKKSIYTTVAENFGSKGYGAFFKGLFSALGHKDQEEMSEKQANEMMKYLQQAEAIDYIKNTNEQLDQMYKKAQLQKQADEYFQINYQKLMGSNLPSSEKQNVTAQLVKRAGEMAGEQKTLDGIGNNGDLYIQNQKGNLEKVAVDPVENAISNYRDLQNNYQYPQSNSSNPYQKLVNDQNQTRINYDQNGRMQTQQPQNPIQAEQRQENIQQDSQEQQPKEEPWMKYMSEAENNVYREPNASEYKPEELKPFIEREAKKLYFEDQKEQKKNASERERVNYEIQAKNFHKNFDEFNSNKNGVSQLMNYDALNKNEKFFDQMENIIKNNKTQGLPEGFFKDFLNVLTNNRASNQLIAKLETEGFASVKDYVFKDSRLTDQDAQIIMNLVPKASDTKEVALQKLNDLVVALKSQKQKIENNYTILRKGLEKFDPESLSLFEEQNQEIINGIKLKQQSKNKENSQEQSQEEFNNEQQKYSIKKENGKVNFILGDKQVELTQNQVEKLGDITDLKGKNIEFTNDQLQTLGLLEKENSFFKKTGNFVGQKVGEVISGLGKSASDVWGLFQKGAEIQGLKDLKLPNSVLQKSVQEVLDDPKSERMQKKINGWLQNIGFDEKEKGFVYNVAENIFPAKNMKTALSLATGVVLADSANPFDLATDPVKHFLVSLVGGGIFANKIEKGASILNNKLKGQIESQAIEIAKEPGMLKKWLAIKGIDKEKLKDAKYLEQLNVELDSLNPILKEGSFLNNKSANVSNETIDSAKKALSKNLIEKHGLYEKNAESKLQKNIKNIDSPRKIENEAIKNELLLNESTPVNAEATKTWVNNLIDETLTKRSPVSKKALEEITSNLDMIIDPKDAKYLKKLLKSALDGKIKKEYVLEEFKKTNINPSQTNLFEFGQSLKKYNGDVLSWNPKQFFNSLAETSINEVKKQNNVIKELMNKISIKHNTPGANIIEDLRAGKGAGKIFNSHPEEIRGVFKIFANNPKSQKAFNGILKNEFNNKVINNANSGNFGAILSDVEKNKQVFTSVIGEKRLKKFVNDVKEKNKILNMLSKDSKIADEAKTVISSTLQLIDLPLNAGKYILGKATKNIAKDKKLIKLIINDFENLEKQVKFSNVLSDSAKKTFNNYFKKDSRGLKAFYQKLNENLNND